MTIEPVSSARPSFDELPENVALAASRIDEIDRRLIELLLDRFRYSRHIGRLKAQLGVEPFDPLRVSEQKAAFVELSMRGGLDAEMAASVIDAILAQVVAERLQQLKAAGIP